MKDHELTERPGRGWTPWAKGQGDHDIERVWWMARVLHFPQLNVSCWFDGSEMVGLDHWGYRRAQWTMKKPPADHPPVPEAIKRERERAHQEALDRIRIAAEARMMARIQATGRRQSAPDAEAV
ncbi:hypothetical protein [Mesorhizobium sp. B2-7-1]|uniref:hypothetical protein n=1 Tax=Mesorhizobium sp. B2-7-1 TaxID=2589909 RepID=UPI0011265046|nr:hypothetical protein [Mesorhizobium sp. B2-7-1]TPJ46848.1 hypothetical protein FJ471_31435 [Mesorhizobium sp. B2-7-1]